MRIGRVSVPVRILAANLRPIRRALGRLEVPKVEARRSTLAGPKEFSPEEQKYSRQRSFVGCVPTAVATPRTRSGDIERVAAEVRTDDSRESESYLDSVQWALSD